MLTGTHSGSAAAYHVVGPKPLGPIQQLHSDLLAVAQAGHVGAYGAVVPEDLSCLFAGLQTNAQTRGGMAHDARDLSLQRRDAAQQGEVGN